jgi:hypothetical protein
VKNEFHRIKFESGNVAEAKIRKICHQFPIDPECGASVAQPRCVGFHHQLVAIPSVPLGHEIGPGDEVWPEVTVRAAAGQDHSGWQEDIAPLGSLLRMIHI